MSARLPPRDPPSGTERPTTPAARQEGPRVRHVRLFVAAHGAAAALIYGIALLAGGGLGASPWPANELVLRRVPTPKAAPAPQPVAQLTPAVRPDDRPAWLAQRPDELPVRAVPDLRPRNLDRAP